MGVLLVIHIIYRRRMLGCGGGEDIGDRPDWAERPGREFCCSICTPSSSLMMFHHLEHRFAFLLNLVCLLLGVPLPASLPLVVVTLIQTILSYLYSEDLALCGLNLCCLHLVWVRRTPRDHGDEEMVGQEDK